jgi:hypothetical protein
MHFTPRILGRHSRKCQTALWAVSLARGCTRTYPRTVPGMVRPMNLVCEVPDGWGAVTRRCGTRRRSAMCGADSIARVPARGRGPAAPSACRALLTPEQNYGVRDLTGGATAQKHSVRIALLYVKRPCLPGGRHSR